MAHDRDISDSVLVQQAVQRLVRWHAAVPGRTFRVTGGDATWDGKGGPLYGCSLGEVGAGVVGWSVTATDDDLHDAIDGALDKAGAPS
jgi:hypothetical protein